jgi:hypothetical protein
LMCYKILWLIFVALATEEHLFIRPLDLFSNSSVDISGKIKK